MADSSLERLQEMFDRLKKPATDQAPSKVEGSTREKLEKIKDKAGAGNDELGPSKIKEIGEELLKAAAESPEGIKALAAISGIIAPLFELILKYPQPFSGIVEEAGVNTEIMRKHVAEASLRVIMSLPEDIALRILKDIELGHSINSGLELIFVEGMLFQRWLDQNN